MKIPVALSPLLALGLVLAASPAIAAAARATPTPTPGCPAPDRFADAASSDPVALGWMQGSPPPRDRQIRFADGSTARFPQTRWAFSHWRELLPTVRVARGDDPASRFERAERTDIDGLAFVPIGASAPMTWPQSLAANYTDGLVVLHRGRIVYERYAGALTADGQHLAMSVTKSFTGTLTEMLIEEGRLDAAARVDRYLPELTDSGFGDATVRQVLDMTTALDYDENYTSPDSAFITYGKAAGFIVREAGYSGPDTVTDFLRTIGKSGEHGAAFSYRSPNTDVLAWLLQRVTGKRVPQLLEERFWGPLGMEQDASYQIDAAGTPLAAGGLNLGLRDLARFGEVMRQGGRLDGHQVVPEAVVARIRAGGRPGDFAGAGYTTLPGWSYRSQWWVSHDDHGVFMARGVNGQAIYVDPAAEMVVARFGSNPVASNKCLDPTTLPAFRVLAEQLMRTAH